MSSEATVMFDILVQRRIPIAVSVCSECHTAPKINQELRVIDCPKCEIRILSGRSMEKAIAVWNDAQRGKIKGEVVG